MNKLINTHTTIYIYIYISYKKCIWITGRTNYTNRTYRNNRTYRLNKSTPNDALCRESIHWISPHYSIATATNNEWSVNRFELNEGNNNLQTKENNNDWR